MDVLRGLAGRMSWIRMPFVYGEAIYDHHDGRKADREREEQVTGEGETRNCDLIVKRMTFNGLISSIQLFFIIISTTTAIILSAQRKEELNWKREHWNMIVLVALMILGIVVMTGVWKYRRYVVASGRYRSSKGSSSATGSELRVRQGRYPGRTDGQTGRSRVIVVGLLIFYVCGSLLDLLLVAAKTSCVLMQSSLCPTFKYQYGLVVQYVFHLVRIVYLGVVAVFCSLFSSCSFFDRCIVRYALAFLQSINVSIWFDAIVHRRISYGDSEYGPRYRCDGANGTDPVVVDCHNQTFFYRVEVDASPLVRPFTVQFSLLVSSFFCQWFLNCVKPRGPRSAASAVRDAPPGRRGRRRAADVSGGSRDRQPKVSPDEASPLLDSPGSGSLRTTGPRSAGLKLWILIVFVVNTILSVLTIPGVVSSYVFNNTLLFYWITVSCAIYLGLYISREFSVKTGDSTRFSGLDFLLLFTSAGPVAYAVFTFIAIIGREKDSSAGVAFGLTLVTMNLFQACSQVMFGLYSARLDIERSGRRSKSIALFRGIVFFLAVSNGALWIGNSVNEIALKQPFQTLFYGHDMWIVINNIVRPMSLFFRFNSCLHFIRIYRKSKWNLVSRVSQPVA